jgi:hypothetical protein
MWKPDEYSLDLPVKPSRALAEKVFALAWRLDFSAPGFCLLDAGPRVESQHLRRWIVDLKERLSEIGVERDGRPFAFRSMGRFDQQQTTKFHLDGAPSQSMLMLGYEPSRVRSRLYLADYTRAAFDLGITPQQLLSDFNPMYRKGEELLARYITELSKQNEGHARILLVNNSSLPFVESRTDPLGVMHKAEIINPTEAERRIVNSTMLVVGEKEEINPEQQEEFIRTDRISQRVY